MVGKTQIDVKEMIMPMHATLHYNIQETNEYWKTDNLVPLGIITTEVISNSCKHASKNGKERVNIHVTLEEKDNQLMLTIKDNGVGFPEEATSIESSESIGFMLIDMYAQKLNGACTFWNDHGAVTQCKFPLVLGKPANAS